MKQALIVGLQWTWGIFQNVLGLLVALRYRSCPHGRFRAAFVTRWNRHSSMGLGMFIFLGDNAFHPSGGGKLGGEDLFPEGKISTNAIRWDPVRSRVLVHEYGHVIQSLLLGPLFLPVIAIPSLIWANSHSLRRYRASSGISYYAFYPERFADWLGYRVIADER